MSAASGAAYGLVARDTPSPAGAGLAFGLGFYALAYGFLGPALKLTPKLSRSRPADILQHALLHAAFGVATGVVAERLSRRRYSGSH
jgi:hypothetical protein